MLLTVVYVGDPLASHVSEVSHRCVPVILVVMLTFSRKTQILLISALEETPEKLYPLIKILAPAELVMAARASSVEAAELFVYQPSDGAVHEPVVDGVPVGGSYAVTDIGSTVKIPVPVPVPASVLVTVIFRVPVAAL